jgi:hypothetical protein
MPEITERPEFQTWLEETLEVFHAQPGSGLSGRLVDILAPEEDGDGSEGTEDRS